MHEGGHVGPKMQGWYKQEQERRVQDLGQEVGQAGQMQYCSSYLQRRDSSLSSNFAPVTFRKRYKRAYDALRTRGYDFNKLARPRYNNNIATSMYDGIFSALDREIGGLEHG